MFMELPSYCLKVEGTNILVPVLARQPSRVADSLLRSSRGGGMGTPPVYWHTGGGDLYIQPYICTQRMELWAHFFEVLRLLMWWRASRSFSLAKKASGAAFCSLPPSTLGLRHRLRLWPDTAVAPGGGRSLHSCSCPSIRPFGGELLVCSVCLVGSSEDGLRLRLWLSLVPGRTRPLSGGAFALRLEVIGRDFGLGLGARQHRLQHQERGSSSPPSGRYGRS
jgi:hypothetical protein